MLNPQNKRKFKDDKIYRWRLELSSYKFEIVFRPGKDNIVADTFSRVYCLAVNTDTWYQLHNSLCHPGIIRMLAFIRLRNLPFPVDGVRKITKSCRIYNECKPRFYSPEPTKLIKATQPMERLNLDFKGPLPSNSNNTYILTIVDEYSRFPFAIPCQDVKAVSVYKALYQIFSNFGVPAYIHSDRGPAFMSLDLKKYLHEKGVATSRTTPYNPQGNGLVERYNGTIWKVVTLVLKGRNLPPAYWEIVLPDALRSIRSLISTSTNCAPKDV